MLNRKHLIVVLIVLLASCVANTTKQESENQTHHIVLCWLKEPGNITHRQKIIEASYKFRTIPGVLKVTAGEVIKSDRKIVDDSFDVGITLTFANTDYMKRYLVHPQHREAVRKVLRPLVKKIVVYDYQ